jgi:hypothetical protein
VQQDIDKDLHHAHSIRVKSATYFLFCVLDFLISDSILLVSFQSRGNWLNLDWVFGNASLSIISPFVTPTRNVSTLRDMHPSRINTFSGISD